MFATHRRTVDGAIHAAGVGPGEAVYLDPPGDTPLSPQLVITVGQMRTVLVHVDGQTLIGSAHLTDPRAIVQALGVALAPGDALRVDRAVRPTRAEIAADPALARVPALPREITVVHPVIVVVDEGGQRVSFSTTQPTVGEALIAAGYALYEADSISPPIGTPLDGPGPFAVTLSRAAPVVVRADGHTALVRTHQPTVGGLLNELGLALTDGDYAVPGLDAPLPAGDEVRVVRVREAAAIETEPIPFETVYVPDPDAELDQLRVLSDGSEGTLERHILTRYEDSVAVSQSVEGEWVTQQPQARVVAYGTRTVLRTLQTRYGTFQYWRKLRVLATSYSPSTAGYRQPGDPRFGLSATGERVVHWAWWRSIRA